MNTPSQRRLRQSVEHSGEAAMMKKCKECVHGVFSETSECLTCEKQDVKPSGCGIFLIIILSIFIVFLILLALEITNGYMKMEGKQLFTSEYHPRLETDLGYVCSCQEDSYPIRANKQLLSYRIYVNSSLIFPGYIHL